MRRFYDLALDGAIDPALRSVAQAAREAGYGAAQPMHDYFYVKASRKEPFDALLH